MSAESKNIRKVRSDTNSVSFVRSDTNSVSFVSFKLKLVPALDLAKHMSKPKHKPKFRPKPRLRQRSMTKHYQKVNYLVQRMKQLTAIKIYSIGFL